MSYFFTTISQFKEVPQGSLEKCLDELSDKWLFVKEYGKNQDNEHVHVIFKSDRFTRTDKYTELIRKSIFSAKFIANLPLTHKLVVTKNAKNWKQLYKNYLLKEVHNKVMFESLQYKGFDSIELKRLYKEANVTGLVRNLVRLSFAQAPYFCYDFYIANDKCKSTGWSYKDIEIIEYILLENCKDYIIHHLLDEKCILRIWKVFVKLISGVNLYNYANASKN